MFDFDREITELPEDSPGYDNRPEWLREYENAQYLDHCDKENDARACEEN